MTSCERCCSIRRSPIITVIIVFFSLLCDSLLLTLVDPILPDILGKIYARNQHTNVSSDGNNATAPILRELTSSRLTDTINNNGEYGFLVAAKGAAQFICNPFVGLIVTKFGYRNPMLVGSLFLLGSTIAFAFGNSYAVLCVTRTLQGAASSVTAVTGMGLLAATFTDDTERGKIMGYAISGLSLGIVAGPVYGSVLYQFFGQAVPFLILAGIVAFTMGLMLLGYQRETNIKTKDHSMASILYLIVDPYILIVAGNIFLLNLDVSVVLAFLPMRLIDLTNPETWQLGIVVLPTSIGYLISSLIFPRTAKYFPRWLCAMIGLFLSTGTLIGLAFCVTFISMLIVTTFLGLALGMVSVSMQPIFAYLVDIRHSSVYGNVYAISDMAVCLSMAVGPLIGGPVVYAFGFEWLVIGAAIINVSFSVFCVLLRNPPAKVNITDSCENERVPLCEGKMTARSRTSSRCSNASTRSEKVMDISNVPFPKYPDYLSGIEHLWGESDASFHSSYRERHSSLCNSQKQYSSSYKQEYQAL